MLFSTMTNIKCMKSNFPNKKKKTVVLLLPMILGVWHWGIIGGLWVGFRELLAVLILELFSKNFKSLHRDIVCRIESDQCPSTSQLCTPYSIYYKRQTFKKILYNFSVPQICKFITHTTPLQTVFKFYFRKWQVTK